MILLIDNYDSFTYNLVQCIGELNSSLDVHVFRNDRITVGEADELHPEFLIISPGPCTPKESGISADLIKHFRGRIPILGVCLGHQTIAEVHEIKVRRHDILMHGKTSNIYHDGKGIFDGISNPFVATRYHSLIVDRKSLTDEFEVSAWTLEDEVMGLRWMENSQSEVRPMDGVQFHPESFLTVEGPQLMANFLGVKSHAIARQ